MRRALPTIAIAALLALPAAAQADRALMLTTSNQLIAFDTAAPNTATSSIAITGLLPGETLRGIDFRPATGQLYGWSSAAVGNSKIRTHTIDPTTGAATFVGQTGLELANVPAGFSFDAGVDRARYIDTDERNFRIRPNDGTVPGTSPTSEGDFSLSEKPHEPDVIAVAYDRSFAGATLTTAYAIDRNSSRLDLLGGVDGFPPVGSGAVTPIGPLGFNLKATDGGFDISVDGRAFAALTNAADNVTSLYSINLATGAATAVGPIGSGASEALSLALVPGTEELPDRKRPVGLMDIRSKLQAGKLRASQVKFKFSSSEACAASASLVARGTTVATGSTSLAQAGVGQIKLKVTKAGKGLLGRLNEGQRLKGKLTLTLTDAAGNAGESKQGLTLHR